MNICLDWVPDGSLRARLEPHVNMVRDLSTTLTRNAPAAGAVRLESVSVAGDIGLLVRIEASRLMGKWRRQ